MRNFKIVLHDESGQQVKYKFSELIDEGVYQYLIHNEPSNQWIIVFPQHGGNVARVWFSDKCNPESIDTTDWVNDDIFIKTNLNVTINLTEG